MNSIVMNIDDSIELNLIYTQLKKQYPKFKIAKTDIDIDALLEEAEDEYLLALALEREKNDNGVRWTFEQILAEDGITLDDLDPEGVEIA